MSWLQWWARNLKPDWFCNAGTPSPTEAAKGLKGLKKDQKKEQSKGREEFLPSILEQTS